MTRFLLFISFVLLFGTLAARAVSVTQVDSIAALRMATATNVNVNNYYSTSVTNDGGGGEFVLLSYSGTCPDDGGVVITSGTANKCYYRQFTGAVHLKWYGVASSMTTDINTECYSSTNCLLSAFNAAASFGNDVVDTDGLYFYSSQEVVPLSNQRLTCGASQGGLTDNSHFDQLPGSIIFGSGKSLHITNNAVEIDHCIILTTGSVTYPVNLTPGTQRDALINNANVIANGDTAIFCDGKEQPYIHDVLVVGFDTGIASFNCGRVRIDGANIDAMVPIYVASGKSPAQISHINAETFLSRNVPGKNVTYDTIIQNVVQSSANPNLCQVVLSSSLSTTQLNTGDYVYFNGSGSYSTSEGVLACEGLHKVIRVSGTQFDLVGTNCPTTNCAGADFLTPGATWVKGSQVLHVTDTTGIHANETVTSSDLGAFPTGTVKVVAVSPYSKTVVVDTFTQDASSGSPTMKFRNPGAYGSGLALYNFAAVHIAAGNSLGGLASRNVATCLKAGGPGDTSAEGIFADNIFCFQYEHEFDSESADPFVCTGCGFDNQPSVVDNGQYALLYGQATPPLVITGQVDSTNHKLITNLQTTTTPALPIGPSHAGFFKNYIVNGSGISADPINSTDDTLGTITLLNNATPMGTVTLTATPNTAQEDTGAADFVGTDFAGGGGVIIDAPNGACNAIQGGITKANSIDILAVEFKQGCANVNLSTTKQNDVLVGVNTRAGSSMVGSAFSDNIGNPNHNGAIFYESPGSSQFFGAVANYFPRSGQSNTANLGASANCPSSTDAIALVLCGTNAGGNADKGNTYWQCNPGYLVSAAAGCLRWQFGASGSWQMKDSTANTVAEFNDATHLSLPTTYQDNIAAVGSAYPVLNAGVNVVATCSGTGCGVQLPSSTKLLDVTSSPPGTACAAASGKCGAVGGITVVNNSSLSITIVPTGLDTINPSTTISTHQSKTFWPISGVGYISN